MSAIIIPIIAAAVALVISIPVTWKTALSRKEREDANKIGSAEEKARQIIDDAIKTAESKKKESLLEIKEQSIAAKAEVDKEIKDRRAEISKQERRIQSKEDILDKKNETMEKREADVANKKAELAKKEQELVKLEEKKLHELEMVSGMTAGEAKEYLLKSVEDDVRVDVSKIYKQMLEDAKNDADKKAREYVVDSIQRCAVDHVAEATITVVELPNDEIKGRIIGREGRNIRQLETLTGIDLIIDDTPEAVVLSGFDPIRREIAAIALNKLIIDGRIHPARIEEMVEKAKKEVDARIKEAGENAAYDAGIHNLHPELVKYLGRMQFRTSYGQNALKHSLEVSALCGLIASECGCDVKTAKRAGLLHDIGKSIDHEVEGSHIQIGADLCRRYNESDIIINAVESHHGDVEPKSLIACIVQAADAISAARPGARRETMDTYINRLKQLEDIANGFKGVSKSFAIQAGREVRVMVVPDQVSDSEMVLLARDIAKTIEEELKYPGQIKVNVIRETRVSDIAK